MNAAFEHAIRDLEGLTLVDPASLWELWTTAQECSANIDDAPLFTWPPTIVEVGVYKGGSALVLRRAVPHARLFLFDTFAGHPATDSVRDTTTHHAGRFGDTSVESVLRLFEGEAIQPTLVVGRFPDSLAQFVLPRVLDFVHCDVDLYRSTLDVFEQLWPLLREGGAIICDDYGFDDCPGAHAAVQEFVAAHPAAELQELTTPQARVRKRPGAATATVT